MSLTTCQLVNSLTCQLVNFFNAANIQKYLEKRCENVKNLWFFMR